MDWWVVILLILLFLNIPIFQRALIVTPICIILDLFDGYPIDWVDIWHWIWKD